jgi:two-component system cell cycle sensor histidine kinase/response regulator CckA
MKTERQKQHATPPPSAAGELVTLLVAALEAAANPILISRRDGTVLWVNPAFEQLSGYTRAEALGQNTALLKSGLHPPAFYKSMWETILSGQRWRGELVNRRKDGSLYHEEMTITPVKNRAGAITHFIAIKLDITDRKFAEERICRLAQVVENSTEMITIGDSEGRISFVNQALLKATGYEERDLVGKFFGATLISPNNPPGLDKEIRLRTISEGAWRGNCLRRRKDGSEFPMFLSTGQIKGAQGAVLGTFGISRDISANVNAENERRMAEERFHKAFHASPMGMGISTLEDGIFLEVNEALTRLTEYESAELIGKKATDLYVLPEDRSSLVKLIHSRVPVRDFKFQLRTKSGKIRKVQVAAEPLTVQGARCILAIVTDTTEHESMEQQLRQAQRMEAVGSLAAGVAHDFNNVLGVILGNLELLSERIPPDEICQKYLGRVRTAVNSATAVTRQLLAFSRKQILQPVILDLNASVEQLHKMTQRLIGENIQVIVSLAAKPPFVKADPGQIEQVLINLVINARDAMPLGGKLLIQTENVCLDRKFVNQHVGSSPGEFAKLTVGDTGIGMDKGVLARIFEPFFTTKELGKGTGLGLATVYGIVKQSNGYICVESEPGAGATFEVYLPIVEGKTAAEQRQSLSGFVWGSETILLVEDEHTLREVVRIELETLGYHVLEAADAERALHLFRERKDEIALLLTDVVMPGMNGRILGNKLREERPDLKILFMSGYTDDEILRRNASDSNHVIVTKPFSREVLASRIRESLDRVPVHPKD